MSWYLTLRGASDYSRYAETIPLVQFLATLLELRQTGPVAFEGAIGQPWIVVILANCDQKGGYCTDGKMLPRINVVELVCSDFEDPAWYDALAGKIAMFLQWSAFENHADRRVWPPASKGTFPRQS